MVVHHWSFFTLRSLLLVHLVGEPRKEATDRRLVLLVLRVLAHRDRLGRVEAGARRDEEEGEEHGPEDGPVQPITSGAH